MTAQPYDALRAAGWQVDVLDLGGVTGKAAFMDRAAAALRLPDWFGRNWDALADCLGDPDWGPADPGRLLVVTRWQEYAARRPEEWATALEILDASAAPGPYGSLAIHLALGGSHQPPGPVPG
ncbi:barstar family protein [Streptomyces sp. NPDC048416]|uniref:barstar family protein n=1 Tax=Streptomyces sp. NPDC048416 TaxID=3365546 RepID=UPI003721087C